MMRMKNYRQSVTADREGGGRQEVGGENREAERIINYLREELSDRSPNSDWGALNACANEKY